MAFIAIGYFSAFSDTNIKLSGTVANTYTGPIKGVVVTLVNKQVSDTTDSAGKFSIPSTLSSFRIPFPASDKQSAQSSTVSLYNLQGHLIGQFRQMPTGIVVRKNISTQQPSSSVYIMRYDIPQGASVVKCIVETGKSRQPVFRKDVRLDALSRRKAVCDTLRFMKNGYSSKRIGMNSLFDTLITVTLDEDLSPFPTRKPTGVDKVLEVDNEFYETCKVWDIDYVCNCRKTALDAAVYIQVSPIEADTFHWPPWSPKYYRVVNAWILADGKLETVDSAGYNPGGNHGTEWLWFVVKGMYYTTGYSSMGVGARRCGGPDCLDIYTGTPPAPIVENGCARSLCADRPKLPISCVRVNANGTIPPFVDLYAKGDLPCTGDGLCK